MSSSAIVDVKKLRPLMSTLKFFVGGPCVSKDSHGRVKCVT